MNIKVLQGSRSEKYAAKQWACKVCGHLNEPTKHLIFDLPNQSCQCGQRFEGLVYFCLGDVEVNGYSILPEVKNQGKTEECIAYAFCHGVEMNNMLEKIILGELPEIDPLDPMDLAKIYNEKFPNMPDIANDSLEALHKVLYIGLILREFGCKSVKGTEARQRVSDIFTVPIANFWMICQMIADGRSVIATVPVYDGLAKLRFGEIYDSTSVERPDRKGKGMGAHAILLIGAIVFDGRGIEIFLNSWGKEFCALRDCNGNIVIGGMGMIFPYHHCNPIVLCRSWEKVINGKLEGDWDPQGSAAEQLWHTRGKKGLADLEGVMIVGASKSASIQNLCDDSKMNCDLRSVLHKETFAQKLDQFVADGELSVEKVDSFVSTLVTPQETMGAVHAELCEQLSEKDSIVEQSTDL